MSRVTIAMLGVAAALASAACGGPPPPPYKPVADVKQLMQAIVDPASDVVWESVATIFTKAGVEERRPRTKEEWEKVRTHAMMLTESGNLLMMPTRAKDGGDWMKMSQGLIDTAVLALRAAEAHDADQLLKVGGDIDEACETCHKKYWPNY
jgi:cytochrome c556